MIKLVRKICDSKNGVNVYLLNGLGDCHTLNNTQDHHADNPTLTFRNASSDSTTNLQILSATSSLWAATDGVLS